MIPTSNTLPSFPMRRPTVYLDSTIPSYLVTERKDALAHAWHLVTVDWWQNERSRYDLFISDVVLDEIGSGGHENLISLRRQAIEGLPGLGLTTAVYKAAQYYVEQVAMPRRDYRDAFHLALASVHGIDYLLTWNFTHLANVDKRRHLTVLNRRLKLPMPTICSPMELLTPKL